MQCVCCNRPEGHNKVGKTSSFRSGPGPCSYKNIGPSRQPAPLLLSCRKPGRRSRAPSIHLLLLLLTSSPAENLGRERWRGAGGEGSAESLTGSTMIMTPWEDLFFVINNLLLGEEPVSKEISLTSRHRRMPVSEMIFSEPTCRFDEKRKNKYFLFFF